jgi:hypothetical protein
LIDFRALVFHVFSVELVIEFWRHAARKFDSMLSLIRSSWSSDTARPIVLHFTRDVTFWCLCFFLFYFGWWENICIHLCRWNVSLTGKGKLRNRVYIKFANIIILAQFITNQCSLSPSGNGVKSYPTACVTMEISNSQFKL